MAGAVEKGMHKLLHPCSPSRWAAEPWRPAGGGRQSSEEGCVDGADSVESKWAITRSDFCSHFSLPG